MMASSVSILSLVLLSIACVSSASDWDDFQKQFNDFAAGRGIPTLSPLPGVGMSQSMNTAPKTASEVGPFDHFNIQFPDINKMVNAQINDFWTKFMSSHPRFTFSEVKFTPVDVATSSPVTSSSPASVSLPKAKVTDFPLPTIQGPFASTQNVIPAMPTTAFAAEITNAPVAQPDSTSTTQMPSTGLISDIPLAETTMPVMDEGNGATTSGSGIQGDTTPMENEVSAESTTISQAATTVDDATVTLSLQSTHSSPGKSVTTGSTTFDSGLSSDSMSTQPETLTSSTPSAIVDVEGRTLSAPVEIPAEQIGLTTDLSIADEAPGMAGDAPASDTVTPNAALNSESPLSVDTSPTTLPVPSAQ